MIPAGVSVEEGARVMLSGSWTLARIGDIDAKLAAAHLPASPLTLDGARLETLDTAAALALLLRTAAAGASIGRTVNLKPSHTSVIETVRAQMGAAQRHTPRRSRGIVGAIGGGCSQPRDYPIADDIAGWVDGVRPHPEST